jgi:glycopeptide antibiotics resistance protein
MNQGCVQMVQLWRAFGGIIPIFLLAALIIVASSLFFRGKNIESKQLLLNILFRLTIVGILLVTLFPSQYGKTFPRIINLVPFVGMYNIMFHSVDISVPIRNLGFNILLFFPFGFFLSWLRSSGNSSLFNTTLKGLYLSLFVELVQYIFPMGRSADIDDLILNTLGTFLGCIIWRMLYNISSFTFGLPAKMVNVKGESI